MASTQSQKPNVVVFFTDQQRWDTTGAHGNPADLTPNFDLMATQGTFAQNCFTCQPVCAPARASFQTGMYATQTGVFRNGLVLPGDMQTLAGEFRDAGYATGYIGKWHLGSDNRVRESERGGYEYWLAANALEYSSNVYNTIMYDRQNRPVFLPGYRVDALTDAAIRYISDHRQEPFFLFLSYLEPHFQNHLDDYPPPVGYRERYRSGWIPPDLAALGGSTHQHLAGYYGMVKRLDEALGRLRDALISLQLDQSTVVMYSSDHGCHFKTRNAEYKRSCHESSVAIPTAFCGPGFDSGGRITKLVSLVDFAPTLLDCAGIPIPGQMQGRSILPLVRQEPVDWPEEVFIQISESQVGRAIRTNRWKYSVVAPDKSGRDDPTSEHYVEECLYDLLSDPYELCNLVDAETHLEVRAELKRRLIQQMVRAGEDEPTVAAVPQRPSSQRHVTMKEAFSPNPYRGLTQLPHDE